MKLLLTSVLAFVIYTGIAQPAYLKPDLTIPIPKLKFDAKGELVITASATSTNKDFDYLIGKWTLKHRKLKSRFTHSDEWEEFDTVVEDFSILEGVGNMDIGRAIIDGKPWEGRTIRIFDPKTRLWRLHWISSSVGVMDPPVVGSFENGIGHFFTKDVYKGRKIIMMFRWDARNKEFPIWSQAFSPDNGKTWEWNWVNRSEIYVEKQATIFPILDLCREALLKYFCQVLSLRILSILGLLFLPITNHFILQGQRIRNLLFMSPIEMVITGILVPH